MVLLPEFDAVSVQGTLEALGDSDVFRLELLPGRQYQVSVRGDVGIELFSSVDELPTGSAEELFFELLTAPFEIGIDRTITFVAQPDVDYFAQVTTIFNFFPNALDFELEIIETADDANAGVQTSVSIGNGETFAGEFEQFGDQDWVQLDVVAGENYLLTADVGIGDTALVVGFDAQTGERVDLPFLGARSSGSASPQVGFTAQDGVEYFAIAQDLSRLFGSNYSLSLTTIVGDTASDASTTLAVDDGGSVQGQIQAFGDYDWVRLNTDAGTSYQVQVATSSQFPTALPFNLIQIDDATGDIVRIYEQNVLNYSFSAEDGFSYFAELGTSAGATGTVLYDVSLDSYVDDLPNNFTTTAVLSDGDTFFHDGREVTSDVDYIRLDVDAGSSYLITSSSSFFDIVRSDQTDLVPGQLLPAAGLDFADPRVDFGGPDFVNDQFSATLDVEAGFDYFIALSPRFFIPPPSSPNLPAGEITLTEVTPETPDNASTSAVLGLNQTIADVLELASDQDWIRLDLAVGQSASLEVTGIFGADRVQVFFVADDGTVEHLDRQVFPGNALTTVVTGRDGGDLYAQIGAFEGFLSTGGIIAGSGYSVSLTPITDAVSDDPSVAPTLGLDQPLNLTGTNAAETIDGSNLNDTIIGMTGNDSISGFGGADLLEGNIGFDTIRGGSGDDLLDGGSGADSLYGDDGDDRILGGQGFDQLFGGEGNDTLLSGSIADRVFGGDGDDVIRGGTNLGITVDGLFGEAGNDTIFGDGGFDLLDGGVGNDSLDGGAQADNLFGRDGADTLLGGDGLDRLFGGNDDDTANGGAGNDGLFGENGNDTLSGASGNDRFFGGQGNDLIFGESGSDTVNGGAGFDTIDGGTGDDLLFGRFNADSFVFVDGHGNDTIGDFNALNDFERLDFSGISAINSLADLNLGSATQGAATQVGVDVLIDTGGGNTVLLRNVNLGDLDSFDFVF